MARAKTPSFVTEIPLRADAAQERTLLVRLDAARRTYNACLGESLKRLRLLRQSRAYRAACRMPRGKRKSKERKARAAAFRAANGSVGFREYDLHAYAKQFNHSWLGDHLDINTIQKVATRAFKSVQGYGFGLRGKPRFKGWNRMHSVEGKSNASGIRWRDGRVVWMRLELEGMIDEHDPVIAHGLSSRIKFARIVRRRLNGKNRFYVQLVCEGRPYQKYALGEGVVGLDIGPSTIAVVGEQDAFLAQFCAELEDSRAEIRRLQRKLDIKRRANNPDNYLPDGQIRPGPKVWLKSRRQVATGNKLSEMQRKQAAYRKSLHGRMLNCILGMGDTFKLEQLSYRAFQRQFGRSVGMRAPGAFVERLRRKAESAGGRTIEFSTRTTRLSQVCHGCGTVHRKSLSQRWHRCECGVEGQRDLYSAFLATCVEEGEDGIATLNAGRARIAWPGADSLLQAAFEGCGSSSRLKPARGGNLPASFGLSGQRRSQSPVQPSENTSEAQDGVGDWLTVVREPGRACALLGTPAL